jgi:hypothetical protein
MILFGHPYIPFSPFYRIDSIEALAHTPANSTVVLHFAPENLDIVAHLRLNGVRFALHVETAVEAIVAENLGASYLIVLPKYASEIQKVAEHYLFDAKVLGFIDDTRRLNDLIEMRLDGAIFPDAMIKITT